MVPRDPTATHDWLRLLSRLPWWLGVLGAILAYLGLHGLASQAYPPGQTPGTGAGPLLRALAELGQWLLPAALLAVAAVTGYTRWRASLLHRELTADPVRTSLRDLSPSDFEALVAEVFRHQGYQVSEPVTRYSGGPREILLTRPDEPAIAPRRQASPRGTSPSLAVVPLPLPASHGTPTPSAVVHIRYWQAWRVGASEVRELIAAVASSGAKHGVLVVPGGFSRDARRMAESRLIALIDGVGLRTLIQTGREDPSAASSPDAISPLRGPERRWGSTAKAAEPRRRSRIPIRYLLRLIGVPLAAAAILGGFDWIVHLPDKRLAPAEPPKSAPAPAAQAAASLVPEPPVSSAPAPLPPALSPPSGPGGFRSVRDLDAAFDAFYMPPPGCADPSSQADMVACANHRIRAREGYMAADTSTEPEQLPDAQDGQDEELTWNDEAAINALVPPPPDPPVSDAEESDPGDAPAPQTPPTPRKPEYKDPAATYAPYDPKAPWVQP